jgi:hypothetical protein
MCRPSPEQTRPGRRAQARLREAVPSVRIIYLEPNLPQTLKVPADRTGSGGMERLVGKGRSEDLRLAISRAVGRANPGAGQERCPPAVGLTNVELQLQFSHLLADGGEVGA